MTRAVRLLCDWLFEQGVGRLELRTHPGQRAVATPRRASRASSARGSNASRSGCTAGGRTRSSGRCSRTTRDDAALPAQSHARRDPDQARARSRAPRRGEARRCARARRRCSHSSRASSRSRSCSSTTRGARFQPAPAEPAEAPAGRPRRAALAAGARRHAPEHGRPHRARAHHARPTADPGGAPRRESAPASEWPRRSRCRASIRALYVDPRQPDPVPQVAGGTTLRRCRTGC